jgi:hypothetical protein
MCSPQRSLSIMMMAAIAVAACSRRNETQGAAGAPVTDTSTASANAPVAPEQPTAHEAAEGAETAGAPATGTLPRPEPLSGCTSGLTSPEQVCECLKLLLRGKEEPAEVDSCTVQETSIADAKIAEVQLEADATPVVMHRIGTGWAALYILSATFNGYFTSAEFKLAASQAKTFGSHQALWIEVDLITVDAEGAPRFEAQITRTLTLCLVGEAVAPRCVLQVLLSGEQRSGQIPQEVWVNLETPTEHISRLHVVSSYRLRVEVSDDGKATIAAVSGEPPEDVRPLLGSHALWEGAIGASPVTRPTTPPAAATSPPAEAFMTASERLAEFTVVVPLAGGKAHLAAVATSGSHGVLRAVIDGARSDVLGYRTGDCAAGGIVELETRPDGIMLFRYGQDSYTDCDDENEGNPKADIDSHVDCVELRWDDTARAVVKGRQAKATYRRELPDWCRPE